jgi:hypothetical protein
MGQVVLTRREGLAERSAGRGGRVTGGATSSLLTGGLGIRRETGVIMGRG